MYSDVLTISKDMLSDHHEVLAVEPPTPDSMIRAIKVGTHIGEVFQYCALDTSENNVWGALSEAAQELPTGIQDMLLYAAIDGYVPPVAKQPTLRKDLA